MPIQIEHSPTQERLNELGILDCPTWEKEVSTFDWFYDSEEVCYLVQGQVSVTYGNNESVTINKGGLVIFAKGLSCQWQVIEPIKKHYLFR